MVSEEGEEEDEEDGHDFWEEEGTENEERMDLESYGPLSSQEVERLADSLADDLKLEWGGVVQGMASLDTVFGYDHGLLDSKVPTLFPPKHFLFHPAVCYTHTELFFCMQ